MEIHQNQKIFEELSNRISSSKTAEGFKCNCPFHTEKTPSCFVSERTFGFKCFGCGIGGHISKLYSKVFNHVFAVASVKDVYYDYHEKILFIQETAQNKLIQIGSKELVSYLNTRNVTLNEALSSGIGSGIQLGKEINQKFRDETDFLFFYRGECFFELENFLTFPLIDKEKHIVGFVGRSINKKEYKFIKNNDNYKKKSSVFTPNISINFSEQKLFVVEGVFDALSLAKKGFNAIALLGNILYEEQIEILEILSPKSIIFALDNDLPGIKSNFKYGKIFPDAEYLLIQNKDIDEAIYNNTEFKILSRKEYYNAMINRLEELPNEYILEYLNNTEKYNLLKPRINEKDFLQTVLRDFPQDKLVNLLLNIQQYEGNNKYFVLQLEHLLKSENIDHDFNYLLNLNKEIKLEQEKFFNQIFDQHDSLYMSEEVEEGIQK